MKKTLVAMAVGATLTAAPMIAAQADVKIFGKLQVEVVNLDGGEFDSYTQQGDAGGMSRLGFDASKDLGNGLKAIGRYDFQLNPSNGSAPVAREQYVGLAGGWGAFIAGRVQSPYKTYGGASWDPFVATFMQARRSGGMSGDATGHNGFVNDQLAYASPVMAGIKFTAHYGVDETATSPETGGLDGTWGAGVSGNWGPFEVIGAYLSFKNTTQADCSGPLCGTPSIDQAKLGARYKGHGFTAAIQYEDVDNVGSIRVNGNRIGAVGKGKIIWANLGYKFGNTLITGSYGSTDAKDIGSTGIAQPDIDYWMIGARYYLAKKVSTYIGYSSVEQNDKYKMYGIGMRYDF